MNIKKLIKDEYSPALDTELIEDLADLIGRYLWDNGGSFTDAVKAVGKDGRYSDDFLSLVSARVNEMTDEGRFGGGVEDDDAPIDGVSTRQEAGAWLNKQIAEHGNTKYFPADVNSTLNALIERFGNTYFWK